MVVADPSAELLALVTDPGDPPVSIAPPAAQRSAELIRRRFGLALPPPFAGAPAPGEAEPVRKAEAVDGAAIASVKWRAFGANYRGVLPDDFLDRRDVVPPASFWQGRAMLPPTRHHHLWVWGRPGTVFGYIDTGPLHERVAGDGAPEHEGEVYELYVDPSAQGRGGGTRLLRAAEEAFDADGFTSASLTTVTTNVGAQRFYRSRGWEATGEVVRVELDDLVFDECRFARSLRGGRS